MHYLETLFNCSRSCNVTEYRTVETCLLGYDPLFAGSLLLTFHSSVLVPSSG
jgi:hypothetical protein